jgi:hypothetical protein
MKNEIILPIELASSKLSLADIGTLFVLMCIPHMNDEDRQRWSSYSDFTEEVAYLIDEGIVIPSQVDGDLHVEIDLANI